ncbi:hypothetical protein, partial [Escherichia coli]|uniref:hypothetical protein n=1 Tax=Escherichia coli TaxID=562 RepID=UPI001BAEC8A8
MYTESNVKLSCNALWQKCVLATLYRAAATHPEIKLLQFKLIPGQGINKTIPSLMADFTGELNRPGFPGECFICELRLPDHRFRWKHNKLFLLLPEEYGPAF